MNNDKTNPPPSSWKQGMKGFLDILKDSGAINMFGAAKPLQEAFDLSRVESRECLQYWMATFHG